MSDPAFSQPDRPNFVAPILIAVVVLAAIAAALFYFNPHDTAALSLSNTAVVPTRTNFKSTSNVIADRPSGQDDLFVFTTLRIDDHLRLPITIDTASLLLVTKNNEQSESGAIPEHDLPAVFTAFPQTKPLAAPPLLRETAIPPGGSATGQLVFHFPITKAVWDTRQSATLTVALYHQKPQTILLP